MSTLSDGTLYCETFIEHAEDGFRHRFFEVDGVYQIEYQEYVNDEGKLCSTLEGGHWKTKDTFSGLWIDEVDKICAALQLVASNGGSR